MAITIWNDDDYSFQGCIHHRLVGWSKLKGAQTIRRSHAAAVISACTRVETMHFFMQLPLLEKRNRLSVKKNMGIKQDSTARHSFCRKYTPRYTASSKQIKERKYCLSLSLSFFNRNVDCDFPYWLEYNLSSFCVWLVLKQWKKKKWRQEIKDKSLKYQKNWKSRRAFV